MSIKFIVVGVVGIAEYNARIAVGNARNVYGKSAVSYVFNRSDRVCLTLFNSYVGRNGNV